MAEEEVARFIVGNDRGVCKAALAGDDAPRDCSVTSRSADSTRENSPGLDTARTVKFIALS